MITAAERELVTVNDVLRMMRDRNMPNVVVRKTANGWENITAAQMYCLVSSVAAVLRAWGIRKGDRVAIISENRVEWAITDFACLGIGAVDVPIYPTLTAEQSEYILEDSESRVVFVSTRAEAAKVDAVRGRLKLEHVVVMDEIEGELGTESFWKLVQRAGAAHEGEFAKGSEEVGAEDLATIIYTSGTTGTPKGVMLTHGNLASNMRFSGHDFGWGVGWRVVSFLPLSHITARHLDYLAFRYGVMIAYCPKIEELAAALQATKPSILVGVPRVYEKIRQEAIRRAGGGVKRLIFNWALRVGSRHADEVLAGRAPQSADWKLADKLVLSKIRGAFGGEVEHYISGSAPLGEDTPRWYAGAGIRIMEGYGLTETSPVISINTMKEFKLGTVGKPLGNLEVRIAADGEILVRGPSVFTGYWKNPEETAAAFEGDWFKTGDIGQLDAENYLSITDRKKDLLKTSGGKFIAPQPIENKLKMDAMVAQAVLVGDKRKFASVILAPNFAMLEKWARENDIHYADRKELVRHPDVKSYFQGVVDEVNAGLAKFETIKKVLLAPDEFTVESGEITPTLKLKRRVVEQKYAGEIEAIYVAAEADAEHR